METAILQLDRQCLIQIDRWVDINSAECKEMDDNYSLTKKILRMGMEDGWLFTDVRGYIWGKSSNGERYFPFHFEFGNKKIGYRLSSKAAN